MNIVIALREEIVLLIILLLFRSETRRYEQIQQTVHCGNYSCDTG